MNNKISVFNKDKKYFEEFLRKTNQKNNINDFLINNYALNHNNINILSVGAGSGEDVIPFLLYLKSKKVNFKFFYLDPSKSLFNLFKKKIKKYKLQNNISAVKFDNFESFRTKEKFDIIISSHVFYYIHNWRKSINKIYKMLKNNGKAFIFMQSKYSDNFKFRNKFLKNIFFGNYREKFGEELIEIIKKLNIHYKEQKIISILDMTDTLNMNLSGKRLLSFLLRTNFNGLNNLKPIKEYLIKNTKIKNKKRFFNLIDNYITLYK